MTTVYSCSPVLASALFGIVVGCSAPASEPPAVDADTALAASVAEALIAGCPESSAADEGARSVCAGSLKASDVLRDHMVEPFLWGGQREGRGYLLDKFTNRFNALVWRKMYLSLYMFTSGYTIEVVDGQTILHMPAKFRNQLDMGSYPYPFWHSAAKWEGYQLSPGVDFIIDQGKLIGALRPAARDASRPTVDRTWDNKWQWSEGEQVMPFVSLYSYILSPENPHAQALDESYRALEGELRKSSCMLCHSPDNKDNIAQLEFFNYPNQALYGRHDIVRRLAANTMPPAEPAMNFDHIGIEDEVQRGTLLELARAFEAVGDTALEFDGELKPDVPALLTGKNQ
jgi:hypothetical protein